MKKINNKLEVSKEMFPMYIDSKERFLDKMSCEIGQCMLKNDCIEISKDSKSLNEFEIYMSAFVMSPYEYRKAIDILRKLQSLNSTHVNELIEIFKY